MPETMKLLGNIKNKITKDKNDKNVSHFEKKILKFFNSEFLYIEVWFTDKNSKQLDIVDKTNIALVIKKMTYKKMMRYSIRPKD